VVARCVAEEITMMHEANNKDSLTRRQALAVAAAATAAAVPGCAAPSEPSASQAGEPRAHASGGPRMPVVYLPHGGGPWPFVDTPFGDRGELDALAAYLRSLAALPPVKPKALLVVSAHWEEPVFTVMSGQRPPLFFDYYGFPKESYELTWPAPGDPKLAARTRQLLEGAGFATGENSARGFDHGTFVPLKLTYPAADVPTVQLSLRRGLDPAEHIAAGRALAPLRDEGVFIVGSGMSYHNMRGFHPSFSGAAAAFDAWLNETISKEAEERAARLSAWSRAPSARQAHPREEHLMPLMVIAGAAGADRGQAGYNGSIIGLRLSGFHFA
jgi:aromatic ring-opening dioxygenase catalytic subunit (LigB family)